MINIDLSKVLPNRAHEYLAGFFPGLFFVFSIVLANPDLVARLTANSERSLALGRYATLGMVGMALFLAFVIGNGFLLVVSLVQYLLTYACQFKRLLYRQVCKWPIQRITRWLLTAPRWRRAWVLRLDAHVRKTAVVGFQDWQAFQGCWGALARRLLKVRYGMEPGDLEDDEWEALYMNLGTPKPEDFRGFIVMIACHAAGWAGLAAAWIAPCLRNKFYVGFCLFLILNGLLHDYYVAMRRIDPRTNCSVAIRAVLRDFPQTESHSDLHADSSDKI